MNVTLPVMTSLRVPVSDLNDHLLCVLCGGYLIDATTITECLHSFCRTCIVRYLEASSYCPVCDTEVHSSKPILGLQADTILQTLVYKLVPELFNREMSRRIEFYQNSVNFANQNTTRDSDPNFPLDLTLGSHGTANHSVTTGQEVAGPYVTAHQTLAQCQNVTSNHAHPADDMLEQTIYQDMTRGELFYTDDERISLCLEYTSSRNPSQDVREIRRDNNNNTNETCVTNIKSVTSRPPDRRFLLCPGAVTVGVLKKFIRNKFDLPLFYHIDLIHTKDVLRDDFKLLDVAYIYTWRRTAPLRLYYTVYETKPKVSVPVHITLPSGLRRRHLSSTSTTTSGSQSPEFRIRIKQEVLDPEDSKANISDQIRNFASRRSRAFKLRAHAHVRSHGNNKVRPYCYHNHRVMKHTKTQIKQEAHSENTSLMPVKSLIPPIGSLKVRIPRYMIRGYPFTLRKSRSPSSSERTSSSSCSSSSRDSSLDSDRSGSLGSHHYDFCDDDVLPLVPKIIRRRLSDSSWSSAM